MKKNPLRLGIIAGNGYLARDIVEIYSNIGGTCFIASIDEYNSSEYKGHVFESFSIGSVGAIINYFTNNLVKDIVFVGGVKRPEFRSLAVDWCGAEVLSTIIKKKILGDDNLLSIITTYITSKGFNVISPLYILSLNKKKIISTEKKIQKKYHIDIKLGSSILRNLGSLDVGQSVIIHNGYTLGIEAAEGTDNLIYRCSALRKQNKGGILIKMSKSSQDMRLDVPVIGPNTILCLAENGFDGVVIERSGVITINPKKTQSILDKHDLFLEYI